MRSSFWRRGSLLNTVPYLFAQEGKGREGGNCLIDYGYPYIQGLVPLHRTAILLASLVQCSSLSLMVAKSHPFTCPRLDANICNVGAFHIQKQKTWRGHIRKQMRHTYLQKSKGIYPPNRTKMHKNAVQVDPLSLRSM